MTRGGKRHGAGRPIGSTKKNNKKQVTFRLSQDIVSWLKRQKNRTRIVEKAIREYMKGDL